MAGVKQRGVKSENYKRTVVRDGEAIEIKPVKYYGPGSNGRMCCLLYTSDAADE